MTVVVADGQYVHPVTIDEFRIATAETYDDRRTVRSGRIHNLRAIHGSDGLRRWHPGRA
jgi:FtsP/CotA-like multicopper oxidase with cupredoxin domain